MLTHTSALTYFRHPNVSVMTGRGVPASSTIVSLNEQEVSDETKKTIILNFYIILFINKTLLTMKKTFNLKFMALSVLLMLGHVCVFAQTDPQLNQAVGTTLTGNVVTYRVNNATPITVESEKTYSVSITGLDADGLKALGHDITLNVPVTFREKLGEKYYRFYVTEIKEGSLGNSFYGYTDIKELNFVPAPDETDETKAFVPFTVATNKYTVGNKAFYGCSNMTKLTFTSNCSSIGEYAFQNTAITSFEIPAGCGTISKYAFYNCKSLLTVTVASGNKALTTLGDYVFGNSGVNNINLTNATKLASLTGKPFIYALDPAKTNDVLKEITLPKSLTTIEATVFQNCTFLQKINGLQATAVTEIGDASFLNCRNLTQLDLPNANINKAPFVGCAKLATLTFPDGYNKEIGKGLTSGNLYGVTNPANANYSEADQKALKTITFKANSTKVGFFGTIAASAFKGSLALEKVEFLAPLKGGATIGASAFEDVTTLATLTFNGIDTWARKDKNNYTYDAAITIGASAFKNTGITALDFKGFTTQGYTLNGSDEKALGSDNKAITISANAFSNCADLATVTFGGLKIGNGGSIAIAGNAFSENAKLTSVEFGNTLFQLIATKKPETGSGLGNVTIATDAFVKNPLLTSVKFGTTDYKNIKVEDQNISGGTFTIENGAFTQNVALAKVEFGKIDTEVSKAITGTFTIGSSAGVFGDGLALAEVIFNDVKVKSFTIGKNAFASTSLKKVEFGNIVSVDGLASDFKIDDNAFKGGSTDDKTVKFGFIKDAAAAGKLTATIGKYAFAADMLKSVEIGDIAAIGATIDANAFQGKNLQSVKLGNITPTQNDATVTINADAFQGGEIADKTVVIGKIADVKVGGTTYKLSATIENNAFAGKLLKSLTIGDMTANTIDVKGNNAFANLSATADDAMDETITLGKIGAGLNITGTTVFQGPQAAGSSLAVEIAAFTGAATIPASTFVAPADGEATYIVKGIKDGDNTVALPANSFDKVAGNAFKGSQKWEKGAPVANNTHIKFQGDVYAIMGTAPFTNVNDVEIAVAADGTAYNYGPTTYGSLYQYDDAKSFKIGNVKAGTNVTANLPYNTDNVEEITFVGSVEGTIGTFNSKKIRKIAFTNVKNEGVKVVAGAIKAGAFEAAATAAAAAGQNITVIYQEGQTHDEAVNIFDRNAFVATAFDYAKAGADEKAAADANIVTLYTTTWCKANVFEAADNDQADATAGVEKKYVWRLGYSESDVAPGQDIVAKVAKPAGYTYAYGKLYIPKGVGMKYRIKSEYDAATDKNQVQVYYGQIDNSNSKIYMYQLPIINDYYWIDATDVDQAFMIRTSKAVTEIEAVAVEDGDEEEAKAIEENDNFYYFGAALAKQNQLRYNPAKIVNQELRSNAEFKDRAVYMMDNPATYGYQFRKIDKTSEVNGVPRYMPAKSLYVVAKNGSDVISAAPQLEVIFVDDENVDANTTGIETVKNEVELNSDAIYNLQGVRVSGAQKGIFIKNGKKFVVK